MPISEDAMKLMVESLVVFALSLAAAALIAQGEPAFAEIAVVHAATDPAVAVQPWVEAAEVKEADEGGARWLSP
jgi:hypothetical protein